MTSRRVGQLGRLVLAGAMLIGCGTLPRTTRSTDSSSALSECHEPVEVDAPSQIGALLADEDTDGDKRITVLDAAEDGARGDERFWLVAADGRRYRVTGTYGLSVLLQEMTLLSDGGDRIVAIEPSRIREAPTRRIERSIREVYWDGLTRRIDGENLERILADDKLETGLPARFLFVPANDPVALRYFCDVASTRPALKLQVEQLPRAITPEWVRSLDPRWRGQRYPTPDPCGAGTAERPAPRHGLLVLALTNDARGYATGVPFVVPGGRFNEMYGWDSYFEALGLLADGRVDLAKAMVDNFVYQIVHYGKILNANRTYYLTRSQPPFLTSMIAAVYGRLGRDDATRHWLRNALLAAIREYETVWMGADRLTSIGLSRYFGSGLGMPPEVEAGHFDEVFAARATAWGISPAAYEAGYRAGEIADSELDSYFVHDRCMRESGHDTTYRWDRDGRGNRCADFVTVDLNSLLHKTEVDIARMIRDELGDELVREDGSVDRSEKWYDRARARRELIRAYLWDEERGMFFDYDVSRRERLPYVSATTLYPLWAWNSEDPQSRLVSDEQARRLLETALPGLEMPGGLAASSASSRGPLAPGRPPRQWDFPYGWAPHQLLAWRGMRNHGFDEVADRLTYKWLYTITLNAVEYNGTVPEKFDVVLRSHRVFAEYGNVGTDFDYITREGFGWMNASYQVGLATMPPALRSMLDRLVAPESVDFSVGPAAFWREPPR